MMNRIKKALIVTLASISIIGNVTSAPVQARTVLDVAKNAPITKVIDCNDLTEEMLTTRTEHNVMYIERIIGKVTDNEKNGKVLNPPEDGGYYISYASVKGARKGDTIITYCVYNPFSNYDDDVIERWDFIQ
jgi:hypothetical protein